MQDKNPIVRPRSSVIGSAPAMTFIECIVCARQSNTVYTNVITGLCHACALVVNR